MAGEEGFEPSHAGIKIRCLDQLGDSPTQPLSSVAAPNFTSGLRQTKTLSERCERVMRQTSHTPAIPFGRQPFHHSLRILLVFETGKYAGSGTGHPCMRTIFCQPFKGSGNFAEFRCCYRLQVVATESEFVCASSEARNYKDR